MKTKLLVDKLLKPDHFLYASSQAGPYIGQPVPASSNTGLMRPVSSGDENDEIGDFTYSGEASTTGTQNTLIDSKLRVFGDSILNGATITLTSGVSSGEAKSVTSFLSATGTVGWTGDVAQTVPGVSYTLTLDYSNRSFKSQLIDAGDPGAATFKWSHDGGSTYFGRENPVTDYWRAGTTICTDFASYYYGIYGPTSPYTYPLCAPVLQAVNGNLVVPYSIEGGYQILVKLSSNNGLSWNTISTGFVDSTIGINGGVVLSSGRILVVGGAVGIEFLSTSVGYTPCMYSDDNGTTWKKLYAYGGGLLRPHINGVIELNNGSLLCIDRTYGDVVMVRTSTDGGKYWESGITVHSGSSEVNATSVVQMNDNSILCAYYTKEIDPGTTYAIRVSKSTDNGGTWSGVSTIATSNNDLILPTLAKDVDGNVFCAFSEKVTGAGSSIRFMVSSDNAVSWGSSRLLASNGSNTLHYPFLSTINGHEVVCSYIDDVVGVTAAVLCRVGRSYDYSSGVSPIPCAPNSKKHYLVNDVALQWLGGDGEASDSWSFEPGHWFAAGNVVEDSPQKVWRSITDNATCELVIDLGTDNVFYMNAVALFNCNINSCSIELNSTDSWSSPATSTLVSFITESGTVDNINKQYLEDTSLVSQYSDHELGGLDHYVVMTSGSSNGTSFKIKDNVGSYIVLDTTDSHQIAVTDTFYVYQSKAYKEFSSPGIDRFLRIYIPAQTTPDGYYQIGSALIGYTTTINNTFTDSSYSKSSDYNINMLASLSGTMLPIVHSDRKQKWNVSWESSDTSRKQVQALLTYAKGSNIAFIPDWFFIQTPGGGGKSSTTDVYLVKQTGEVRERFRYKNRWDLSVDFEENI